MRGFVRIALPAAALGLLAVACERAPTRSGEITAPTFSQMSAQGRYIVVLQNGADPAALAASHGVQAQYTYRHALTGFSAALPEAALRALEQHPLVRWVEPVKMRQLMGFRQQQGVQDHKPGHKTPPGGGGGGDKPCKGKKCPPPPPPTPGPCVPGASDATGNDIDPGELYGIEDVNAPLSSTWINSPVDVDIAILDSGADTDHDDLCVHMAADFTGEGFEDFNGHGTHTSGTAAARDDNDPPGQVVGVAPSARIWVVKVCNIFGLCPSNAIVAGIEFVTANADQIEVANMSLGGGGSDQAHPIDPIDCSPITGDAEHLAICNSVAAGVTYVVAAGNAGSDAAGFTPAAFDEVITVSASNIDENAAGFSNFGADVDLIAPGVNIKSSYVNNSYANLSGTSMSSPHVAGGAALYILANPGSTPLQVRNGLVADGRVWAGQGGLHPEPMLDVSKY